MPELIQCMYCCLLISSHGEVDCYHGVMKIKLLWREIVFLEDVEMKKRGGQAHSNVHGCHLVLLYRGGDIAEETEERLQHLPILIRHQHDGRLHSL